MEKKYFATLPAEELGKELMSRVDRFYTHSETSGITARLRESYRQYYGLDVNTGNAGIKRLAMAGEVGEYTILRVNHYYNLGQHLLNLTTSQKPAAQPMPTNSDESSIAQTRLADGLLDYYIRQKRLQRILKQAAEYAIVLGEGWVETEWDPTSGKEYGVNPDTGAAVYEGDLKFGCLNSLDVIIDPYKDNSSDFEWRIVRKWQSRFELAAKFPDLKDKILNAETKSQLIPRLRMGAMEDSDDVPVYKFYHRRSDAVPDGRLVIFLSQDVILFEGPMPYRKIPLRRITPSDVMGAPYGHTSMFDLLAPQQAIDILYSTVITNQKAFGVQNISAEKGSDLSVEQIAGGMNLIEYNRGSAPPAALSLAQTSPEIFNFVKMLETVLETLSGINSTVRGNPESSLKSGASLALVQSQAIQFSSGLQESYGELLEDVCTDIIEILQDFATVPRIATIAGKSKSFMMESFSGKDLDQISRVVVDAGNPLAKTTSGRIQIAQDLLKVPGLIHSAEQYIQVVTTGSLDSMVESQQSELMLIKSENEMMAEGKQVHPASAVDAHKLHIKEHKSVIATPSARENPQVVAACMAHIQDHINQLKTVDPALLNLIGEQSLMPPPSPPGAPAGPGGPGGPPPPPPHPMLPQGPPAHPMPQMGNHSPAAIENLHSGDPHMPHGPRMPINPITHKPWDAQTGGGVI